MTRARDLADRSAVHGRRNLIINGAMQVAQRGDITNPSGEYTLDRYRFNKTNTDNLVVNVTQDTDTPDGFSNSMKVDVTTAESAIASDERCSIEQRIEAQNLQHLQYGTSGAKTLTLSFWVKSSVTGKYGINIRHHDASVNKGLDYTINSADTWEYKQISFTGYTTTAINNDNSIGLWLRWMLIVGTDYQNTAVEDAWSGTTTYYTTTGMQSTWGTNASHNFWLTGVQLEIGEKATPFEHRSYGEELLACQRYYCKSYAMDKYAGATDDNDNQCTLARINSTVTNRTVENAKFPVRMRVKPTVTVYSLNGTSGSVSDTGTNSGTHTRDEAVTLNKYGETGIAWFSGVGGFTAGDGAGFHFTADAEL